MARLGVLGPDAATLAHLERIAARFHKCVARATLAHDDAIAGLFARWLVDSSIDAIVAVATDATRAVLAIHGTKPVPGIDGGRCGKKIVILVPAAEDAAQSELAAALPRLDPLLGISPTPAVPVLSARLASAPTNKTIPLDDADLEWKPKRLAANKTVEPAGSQVAVQAAASRATNLTVQLGDGDIEVQPATPAATNLTIELGDGDVEMQPPAQSAPARPATENAQRSHPWRWLAVAAVIAIAIAVAVALAFVR